MRARSLMVNGRKERYGALEVADPDLGGSGIEIEGAFLSISAAVFDGESTSIQISGALVRTRGRSRNSTRPLLSQARSMALTPSAVESGHSAKTRPSGR